MGFYMQIQKLTETNAGFKPKTCWIAHLLADHGLTTRQAANRIDPKTRANPCPPSKRAAIEAAIRELRLSKASRKKSPA